MLDLCCYSGGFALNAALGGASHTTGKQICIIVLDFPVVEEAWRWRSADILLLCPFFTGVDSSSPALELAKANASLNQIDANLINFVKADVGEYMKSSLLQGMKWDIVVLDPPKLAPNRKVHTHGPCHSCYCWIKWY